MAKTRMDVYPNRAIQSVTMSAANTLTFAQMRFSFGTFTGTALIISRLDFYPTPAMVGEMTAAGDYLRFAITNRDDLSDLDPANMNVLALKTLLATSVGAADNFIDYPYRIALETLPGGGIIVPANPLYLALDTNGLASAGACKLVMYYRTLQLTDADYIELVQSLIPVNI